MRCPLSTHRRWARERGICSKLPKIGIVGGPGGSPTSFPVRSLRELNASHTTAPAAAPAFVDNMQAPGTPFEKPAFDPYAHPAPEMGQQHQPMPVYDPNDPTTFPPTSTSPSIPASTTAYNPSLNMGYASSNPNAGYIPTSMSPPPQQPFSHQPGGYSGVAEV